MITRIIQNPTLNNYVVTLGNMTKKNGTFLENLINYYIDVRVIYSRHRFGEL